MVGLPKNQHASRYDLALTELRTWRVLPRILTRPSPDRRTTFWIGERTRSTGPTRLPRTPGTRAGVRGAFGLPRLRRAFCYTHELGIDLNRVGNGKSDNAGALHLEVRERNGKSGPNSNGVPGNPHVDRVVHHARLTVKGQFACYSPSSRGALTPAAPHRRV